MMKFRSPKFTSKEVRRAGFALPTVLFLVVILSSVAYSTLLQSNNSLNLAYKQSYLQIARVASKSAVDYAQEQFDNSICGDYDGTAEQDMISTSRYRVTLQAEVTGLKKSSKAPAVFICPNNQLLPSMFLTSVLKLSEHTPPVKRLAILDH